ncbi:MAG: 3-hydroxyisobutyrate dehydrogenase [Caulobacterales bacterium]|jgi:3-hydroxyisobutyrate dehydrogenase
MSTVGFIGLGNMGSGMAANLAKAGHAVAAFDLSKAALDKAREAGCRPVDSAAAAAAGAEIVVTMLPADPHVDSVYNAQVFPSAPPGALFIDCSTISVDAARKVIGQATDKGFAMVDAPVSGGVAAAAGGTLTFMVGGAKEAFERADPILKQMGKAVIHAGGAGAGQAAKICNNMLLGVSMIATCEAFVLAEKLGLDPQVFFDISSKASGQNWSMTSYCPAPGPVPTAPSNRDYAPGFATAMMLKDLKLAQAAAASAGASTPMGAAAEALYALYAANGGSEKDFSGIIQMLAGRAK